MEEKCEICGGDDFDQIYQCVYESQHLFEAGKRKAYKEVRDALNEIADGEGRIWGDVIDHWWRPGGKFDVKDE